MFTKRFILSISIFSFFCLLAFPEHVSSGKAEIVALNWAEILRTEFKEDVTIKPGSGHVITRNGNEKFEAVLKHK